MTDQTYPKRMNFPPELRQMLVWLMGTLATASAGVEGLIALEPGGAKLEGIEVAAGTVEKPAPTRLVGFDDAKDRARWEFAAKAGIYQLAVIGRTPHGRKAFEGKVGRFPFSSFFDNRDLGAVPLGIVELVDGPNQLEIGGGWGYYEITGLTLTPAVVPAPPQPGPAVPANPDATPAARSLLRAIAASYGKQTLSGQMETRDLGLIQKAGADAPAIIATDLMFHSPSMVERQGPPKGHPESFVPLAAQGHIISLMWHWNAPSGLVSNDEFPWWRGFYTDGTSFDLAAALADPAGAEYSLLLRDIDAIAVQLAKFDKAGVPILWRPLHEADGGWFWWGAKGPDAFKKLWRILFERLTRHHQLHNLLWVLTVEHTDWYPGDDVVDVACIDVYPTDRDDPLVGRWQKQRDFYDGRKPLALGEYPGIPDIPRMRRLGVHWAWFCSWQGEHGPRLTAPEEIRRIFHSDDVITLRDTPAFLQQSAGE
ncbi:MAG: glycosyl hydrolase [Akkermansiaceae bacterium]